MLTIRKGWSYKEDRCLSELVGSGKTLEQIVKTMGRTPNGIRKDRCDLASRFNHNQLRGSRRGHHPRLLRIRKSEGFSIVSVIALADAEPVPWRPSSYNQKVGWLRTLENLVDEAAQPSRRVIAVCATAMTGVVNSISND